MRRRSPAREYADLAGDYDRRYRRYAGKTHQALLDGCAPESGQRILDAGCGTGLLLSRFAQADAATILVGTDPSAAMLQVASRRLRGAVRLLQAPSEALPLASETIHLLLSASSLHYSQRPLLVLQEFVRVLAPGGRLLLTDWCGDSLAVRAMERYLRCTGRTSHVLRSRQLLHLLAETGLLIEKLSFYRAGWPWFMMLIEARKA